jgi:IS30 family transposase
MAGTPLSAPLETRAKWYLQVDKYGKKVSDVCNIFGISRKTYYKWYQLDHRFKEKRVKRRGLHPQTKLTPEVRRVVYEQKLRYNYGPKKMQFFLRDNYQLNVSTTAIYKYFKRRKLIRKPQKQQAWYIPLKEPYYAQIAGENVQLDVKYVPGANLTWSYQYRFLDTVTNLQYAVEMPTKDAASSIKAFKLAQRYFPFKITGIQTDNGSEFRGNFHKYLVRINIVQRYIPKRSAPWNGKVERANRSIDDEFYLNPFRPWITLMAYVNWYNHERPHLGRGMNGLTPFRKFLSLKEQSVTPRC